MKKFISVLALAVLLVAPMAAQRTYTHSVGVTLGNFEGFSYKGFVLPNSHLALQVDLGFKIIPTEERGVSSGSYAGIGASGSFHQQVNFWTVELNPNILYQDIIDTWDWGGLSWYAGGGVSGGISPYDFSNTDRVFGKVGINAIGGVEMGLDDAPLAISFDIRPGYGFRFYDSKKDGVHTSMTSHFFDWALAIGLRYTF